jgi:hypothetical protein
MIRTKETLTIPHAVGERIYFQHVVKRRRCICGAVKDLFGGLPRHPTHDLIFPMIRRAVGNCLSVPIFLLGEGDAHGD